MLYQYGIIVATSEISADEGGLVRSIKCIFVPIHADYLSKLYLSSDFHEFLKKYVISVPLVL